MYNLAEEVKARARIGPDIIGDKKARTAEQQAAETAATVGAAVQLGAVFVRRQVGASWHTPEGTGAASILSGIEGSTDARLT
jgi:hypothetical protein